MLFLFFVIYILLLFCTKIFSDKISKVVYLSFVNYWMISLMLSMFNPYGLFPVSDRIYFYLLIGVLMFVLGFYIYPICIGNGRITSGLNLLINIRLLIESKTMKIMYVLMTSLVLYTCIKSLKVLAYLYTMGRGRGTELMSIVFDGNSIYAIIYNMFAPSFFHLYLFLTSYLVMFDNKKYKYILFYLIYIVLYASIGGGRYAFISIIIYVILFYFIRSYVNGVVNFSIKIKLLVFFMIITSFVVVSKLSYERENKGYKADSIAKILDGSKMCAEDLIVYNITPFRLFEYALDNDFREKLSGVNLSATFEGVDPYLRLIARVVGLDYNSREESVTAYLQDNWVYTGVDESNYIYTAFLFHYIDFGLIGIFIYPFAFGLIFRYVINMFYKNNSLYALLLIFFFYFMMLNTISTCYLLKVFAIPYCLFLYFLSKNNYGVKRS